MPYHERCRMADTILGPAYAVVPPVRIFRHTIEGFMLAQAGGVVHGGSLPPAPTTTEFREMEAEHARLREEQHRASEDQALIQEGRRQRANAAEAAKKNTQAYRGRASAPRQRGRGPGRGRDWPAGYVPPDRLGRDYHGSKGAKGAKGAMIPPSECWRSACTRSSCIDF